MSIYIDFQEFMCTYEVINDENLKITCWNSSLSCIWIKFYAKIASINVHNEMLIETYYNRYNVEYLY
jgi:hypothetical protein